MNSTEIHTLYIQEPYYKIGCFRMESFETQKALDKFRTQFTIYNHTKTWTDQEARKNGKARQAKAS